MHTYIDIITTTRRDILQVLPGRTHPMMTISAESGYVLSGIKVSLPYIHAYN